MSALKNTIILSLLLTLVFSLKIIAQTDRSEIDEKYKWNLADIYDSKDSWKEAKDALVAKLPEMEKFKGKLTQSADELLAYLELSSKIGKEASKLYIYANMHSDLDTRDMKYSGMTKELQQIFSDFSSKLAFVDPEILSVEWSVIEGFINEKPGLLVYKKYLKDLYLQKEHTLSEPEERILALSGMSSGISSSVYSTFSNAEMPKPEVILSSGEKVILSNSSYAKYRSSTNREDRELVFDEFWNNYKNYQATFGELLYGEVKNALFKSKARHYKSSLEAALKPKNIPTSVYHSLVENVNKNLPAFHRYLEIKKRMMGLDTLKYLDLYAPVTKGVDLQYNFDEAQGIILKSLQPLGEEYVATIKKAFSERWIDVYPTTAKRSGAYSNGAFYDGHPFMLLNYNGLYEDVSTTTHELGHTMHSYFSNKTQPFPLADYTIFVAEVASTFNEVLLFDYMIKTIKDDDVKLSLLMKRLDGFKGTLFRQTQFAEFELKIHEAVQAGKPLTGEVLSEMYMDIVKRYYGHEEGVCYVDDYINMEWAFIPHFYYNFYVYQYSTSFTASNSLAERVLSKEDGAIENYLAFLGSGGSDYPIELLKKAGIDMTSSEAFDKTIVSMNRVMDEIEKILDRKDK
jgi:oligoendopeptidase F